LLKTAKTFKRDIESELGKGNCREGLQALASKDRIHIIASDTRSLAGSADIDSALKTRYPAAARWDYVVGVDRSVDISLIWIEVHPGRTSANVSEVYNKMRWLRSWLTSKALDSYNRRFVWVSSDKTELNPLAPQYKQLANLGC
jgi:hypothetical protein